MHFTTLLPTTLALLFTTASALPASVTTHSKMFTGNPFELTHLSVDRVEAANVTLEFTIHNPDPLANTTATCTGSWPYNSMGWPTSIYEGCGDSSFAWHMRDFDEWESGFVLEVKDTFKDPSVGQPPYDQVTIFGSAKFGADVVTCTPNEGGELCAQAANSTVKAPIDRTIAKR